MPFAYVAAATAIGSTIEGMSAAGTAANQESAGFNLAQQDLQPWMTGGQNALTALQKSLGLLPGGTSYQQSPGYQWDLSQGSKAITNQAAATGGVHSGNTLKALQTYGTGLADQDYQQYLGNLFGLSQQGQQAAGNIGQYQIGSAAAQAGGTIGQANALSQGLGSLGSLGTQLSWQQMFQNNGSAGSYWSNPINAGALYNTPGMGP